MISLDIYNATTGEYIRTVSGPPASFDSGNNVGDNEVAFFSTENPPSQYYYDQVSRELIRIPDQPTKYHTFNFETKTWEADTLTAKYDIILEITAYRELLEESPIMYNTALYDGSQASKNAVYGWQMQIANGAVLPANFVWRDKNNINHPADSNFINGLGLALATRTSALAQVAWDCKAEVSKLTDINQIIAYDYKSKFQNIG